ncbi:MAG: cobalamin biosynthesis protein P47K [Planctomycetota bacterium]|nr:MAG: cobalamin biosynthesis protein P47K [Planctomycetota bacterium]
MSNRSSVSNQRPRFILIGGFLGAGKSTTVARLARHYTDQGKRVGIVTNDQAPDLVDTHVLRQQGFDVGEVAGACFCCSFNELTDVIAAMGRDVMPDVILAEPVGSCTDLVATVIRPLAAEYGMPLDIAPYGVLLKPAHGQKILGNRPRRGFSPKAEYIFEKQIEESDFVVINRIDQLSSQDVEELEQALHDRFPDRPVLRMSARTGEGFAAYIQYLEQSGQFARNVIDVDYDVYAEGEAELGWLNAQMTVRAAQALDLDGLILELVQELQTHIGQTEAEIAHLKAIGMSDGNYAVANAISSATASELSLPSRAGTTAADVVVNARVAIDPAELERVVRACIDRVASRGGFEATIGTLQSFRPGRPVPTHRLP